MKYKVLKHVLYKYCIMKILATAAIREIKIIEIFKTLENNHVYSMCSGIHVHGLMLSCSHIC